MGSVDTTELGAPPWSVLERERAIARDGASRLRAALDRMSAESGPEHPLQRLAAILLDFRRDLERRIELEERGLFRKLSAVQPSSAPVIEALRDEHRRLRADLDRLVETTQLVKAGRERLLGEVFPHDLEAFLLRLQLHEAEERARIEAWRALL